MTEPGAPSSPPTVHELWELAYRRRYQIAHDRIILDVEDHTVQLLQEDIMACGSQDLDARARLGKLLTQP